MQERIKHITDLFLQSLGDICRVKSEYFNRYHAEFKPEIYVDRALDDCRAYFGVYHIPPVVADSVIAELAVLRYRLFDAQNTQQMGIKSVSYSEGSVSKSETYATPLEWGGQVEMILKPYNRFRVVRGHEQTENTE